MQRLEETQIAYLAGLIDGEGSFGIYTYGGQTRFTIRIVLTERDGFVLDHVHSLLGGYRQHRKKQNSWKSHWLEQEEWGARRLEDSLRIAKLLLPHLILKKQVCEDFILELENYLRGRK